MKYYIDYHTGAGNRVVEGTLEDALRIADAGAAYTQQLIYVYDADKLEQLSAAATDPACVCWEEALVAWRDWCSVGGDREDPAIINFGSFGYYDRWRYTVPGCWWAELV